MSIVLVDRNGNLAQAAEAVLRLKLNRGNRGFFYRASSIPLRKWPSYRDYEIAKILDSLEWFSIWDAPDGEYPIRQRVGKIIARKRGDLASLIRVSARGEVCKEESWRRGQLCPGALTPQMIADRWDEFVIMSRIHRIDEMCPEYYIATWDSDVQTAARACRSLAAKGQWREALDVTKRYPSWLPYNYLKLLVEGS